MRPEPVTLRMAVLTKMATGSSKEGAFARLTFEVPLSEEMREALPELSASQSPPQALELTVALVQAQLGALSR